jgi:hypothetical protein
MASEAALWFKCKMKRFASTQEGHWTIQVRRVTEKFLDVLLHPPTELDPSGKLTSNTESGDEENHEE